MSLEPSAISKSTQLPEYSLKSTELMVSTKDTNCSIQWGWILGPDDFAKNYMGSRPGPKKCDFSFSPVFPKVGDIATLAPLGTMQVGVRENWRRKIIWKKIKFYIVHSERKFAHLFLKYGKSLQEPRFYCCDKGPVHKEDI